MEEISLNILEGGPIELLTEPMENEEKDLVGKTIWLPFQASVSEVSKSSAIRLPGEKAPRPDPPKVALTLELIARRLNRYTVAVTALRE